MGYTEDEKHWERGHKGFLYEVSYQFTHFTPVGIFARKMAGHDGGNKAYGLIDVGDGSVLDESTFDLRHGDSITLLIASIIYFYIGQAQGKTILENILSTTIGVGTYWIVYDIMSKKVDWAELTKTTDVSNVRYIKEISTGVLTSVISTVMISLIEQGALPKLSSALFNIALRSVVVILSQFINDTADTLLNEIPFYNKLDPDDQEKGLIILIIAIFVIIEVSALV